MGFIEKEDYLAKRNMLQQQLGNNQPIAEREILEAETRLRKFKTEWESADLVQRKEYFCAMIESVQICGGMIKSIKLRAAFTYLARHATNTKIDAEGFLITQDQT